MLALGRGCSPSIVSVGLGEFGRSIGRSAAVGINWTSLLRLRFLALSAADAIGLRHSRLPSSYRKAVNFQVESKTNPLSLEPLSADSICSLSAT